MKRLIWLDDLRDPFEKDGEWLVFSPIEHPYEVHWVKSYEEFVGWITVNGLPNAICFDHDLGEDAAKEKVAKGMNKKKARLEKKLAKSGFDCAKWLVEHCMDWGLDLPKWNVQSANPVGKDNINGLLSGYLKFSLENPK